MDDKVLFRVARAVLEAQQMREESGLQLDYGKPGFGSYRMTLHAAATAAVGAQCLDVGWVGLVETPVQ